MAMKRITSRNQAGDDILNLFKKDSEEGAGVDVRRRVRVGIIGTGWIAAAHIASYLKMPDVDVVAGADIVEGRPTRSLNGMVFRGFTPIPITGKCSKKSGSIASACARITGPMRSAPSTR